MSSVIYQDQGNSKLVPMRESAFDSEDVLQILLAKHPHLLAGDIDKKDTFKRWLLIKREASVPDKEEGSGRWSLDHLFLDQDGIPTLVEAKRSEDTRIRRNVVGQMLDYAANAIVYWPIQDIQSMFIQQCKHDDVAPEERLDNFLNEDMQEEDLWQNVKTNLQAGRIRMVFVADEIPSELRRIVEFLNSQMDPAEVLAIEIKQYVGEAGKILVPRIIGQTEEAKQKKSTVREQRDKPWDEKDFMEFVRHSVHPEDEDATAQILKWAKDVGLSIQGGRGPVDPSLYIIYKYRDQFIKPFSFWAQQSHHVKLSISFDEMRKLLQDKKVIQEIGGKLNLIQGISLDASRQYPCIRMDRIYDPKAQERLLDTLDWIIQN
jgi:hypothetical protein